jgi:signal transduction histidine kinase
VSEAHPPPGVQVSVEFGYTWAHVDIVKIRRVLDNLIRNACEAISGPGTVTVKADRIGGNLEIEVSDTGVGISNEFMPNLFQTFKTTKKRSLGLGLAYSKKAVEAHGGTITVESKVGEGTKFTVRLPQPSDEGERLERHAEAVETTPTRT